MITIFAAIFLDQSFFYLWGINRSQINTISIINTANAPQIIFHLRAQNVFFTFLAVPKYSYDVTKRVSDFANTFSTFSPRSKLSFYASNITSFV